MSKPPQYGASDKSEHNPKVLRKPSAFTAPPPSGATSDDSANNFLPSSPRKPTAISDFDKLIIEETDIFDGNEPEIEFNSAPASLLKRSFSISGLLISAIGILLSFAIGIWLDDLIRALYARADWLGWTALGITAIAVISLLIVLAREALAMHRLTSVQKLRLEALSATMQSDGKTSTIQRDNAWQVVDKLIALTSALPQTARGRAQLESLRGDIIDGHDLLRTAEKEILRPLDREARNLILNAGKRVSIVTAISPRALVDIAYVIYEAARLIRRLSELYGCRPGTFGFIRLSRSVIAHLAITGTMAMGDSVVHQLFGQGLASRLSAKLGEGVINGMMTVRIGISAMDIVRPLPFDAEKRPGISDFLGDIAKATTGKGEKP